MNDIVLQRSIAVKCWRVIGTLAKAEKRKEIHAVLLRARDNGGTNARDVAEHLLFEPDSREGVAWRLLVMCESLGLLEKNEDRNWTLTEKGSDAVGSEHVFTPKDGTWTIWATNDPLVPDTILRVEPWCEPAAFNETGRGKRDSANERQFRDLPFWIKSAGDATISPAAGDGALVRLERLESKAEEVDPNAELRVMWDVTSEHVALTGRLGEREVNTELIAPDVERTTVWEQLLEGAGIREQWDPDNGGLRVRFDETDEAERQGMVRNVPFQRPWIDGLNRFDDLTVTGIRLLASSAPDARQWARWRLQERVHDYATEERFAKWVSEAIQPFEEFRPSLPTRQELASAAWEARGERASPSAWHLMATEDWGL